MLKQHFFFTMEESYITMEIYHFGTQETNSVSQIFVEYVHVFICMLSGMCTCVCVYVYVYTYMYVYIWQNVCMCKCICLVESETHIHMYAQQNVLICTRVCFVECAYGYTCMLQSYLQVVKNKDPLKQQDIPGIGNFLGAAIYTALKANRNY